VAASCDVEQRAGDEIKALLERGVVEVAGAQPYEWSFACEGGTLRVDVRALTAISDGDPVLWLGAAADPPRLVAVRLDVGSGQESLSRQLALIPRGETRRMNVDLATGVVWLP